MNIDTLQKARRFVTEYDDRALNKLCRRIEGGGAAIRFSHIIVLLSAPPPSRPGLLGRAVRGRWTCAQLQADVRARFGRRHQGGRSLDLPEDEAGRLVLLDRLCVRWRSWHKAAEAYLPVGL